MIVWILFFILEQEWLMMTIFFSLSLPIWSCCDKSVDAFNNNGISEEYTDTNCYTVYIFILLPLLLRFIPYGEDHEDRTLTKTTSTDICTSYPGHILLTLRIYLGG